jgi:hypothetical protein
MRCSDTSGKLPAIHLPIPLDLAADIAYMLKGIKEMGGTGRLVLDVSGGNVTSTELSVKRPRKKSA